MHIRRKDLDGIDQTISDADRVTDGRSLLPGKMAPYFSARTAIPDDIKVQVAAFAKNARGATGLDQRAFAAKACVAQSIVASLEKGSATHVSLNTLDRIARAGGKRLRLTLGD